MSDRDVRRYFETFHLQRKKVQHSKTTKSRQPNRRWTNRRDSNPEGRPFSILSLQSFSESSHTFKLIPVERSKKKINQSKLSPLSKMSHLYISVFMFSLYLFTLWITNSQWIIVVVFNRKKIFFQLFPAQVSLAFLRNVSLYSPTKKACYWMSE